MSEESETNQDNLKRRYSITNNKPENSEILKDPYVKELLVKIDVLKNGIIKERKINADLSSKLKKIEAELTSKIIKLEDELMAKTKEIKTLNLEKNELEKSLRQQQQQQQQQKKGIGIGFFDNIAQGMEKLGLNININTNNERERNPILDGDDEDDNLNANNNNNTTNNNISNNNKDSEALANAKEEIRKLTNKVNQLKFENDTYLKKMNSTLEETENRRLGFKNEIKTYTDKIKKLEEQMKMLEDEKKELQDRIKLTSTISSQTMKETEHFKGLLQEYKKGKEEVEYQLNTCIEKCSKLLEENESYRQAILAHEIDSGKMAQKLAELKNLYIRVNLRNQMFHVKKEGLLSNTEIDIIFGKGQNGNYVMRIDDKDQTELMNIQDVEYVKRVEGSKNKVEISYMYESKKYYITVIVDELIVDQLVEAYKIFYLESMKDQNQIAY